MFLKAPSISLVPITVPSPPFPEINTTESGEFRSLKYICVPLSHALSFHAFFKCLRWCHTQYLVVLLFLITLLSGHIVSGSLFNSVSHLMAWVLPSLIIYCPIYTRLGLSPPLFFCNYPKCCYQLSFYKATCPHVQEFLQKKVSRKRNCWIIRNLHC